MNDGVGTGGVIGGDDPDDVEHAADDIDIDDAEDTDDADDAVLAELRGLGARLDPVPPEALAAARSAIAWRTMDAELAKLTADTSVEEAMAGVRGTAAPTLLTFESPDLTVELEVLESEGGGPRRLLGQLVPPTAGTVEVRHAAGTVRVEADEVGRFSAGDIAPGPVSLRCEARGRVIETDWFLA